MREKTFQKVQEVGALREGRPQGIDLNVLLPNGGSEPRSKGCTALDGRLRVIFDNLENELFG